MFRELDVAVALQLRVKIDGTVAQIRLVARDEEQQKRRSDHRHECNGRGYKSVTHTFTIHRSSTSKQTTTGTARRTAAEAAGP